MFLNFLFTHTPLFYFVQSFWRDEAYSVLLSQKALPIIFAKSSMEPPFYYVLLHFWMKLFGTGEIATRSLSLLGVVLATIVVIEWADKLFQHHWLSKFTPLFFILNPMLIYYAFEVRAYGWYIFFATLALYAFDRKKWKLYTIAVILGIYTHLYLGIIPVVHFLYYIATQKLWKLLAKPKALLKDPMIQSLLVIFILFIPWIIRLSSELQKFKESWYFPVNLNLMGSVLGNMFLGYEGTPWYLWTWTKILSATLLFLYCLALIPKQTRKQTVPLFLIVMVPLISVIGASFIKSLFVNRYLIVVTVAEVILLSYSILAVQNKKVQKILAGGLLLGVILFNIWYPQKHPKTDIRKAVMEANMLKKPNDLIVASDAIVFMETLYYAKDRAAVRLYNPMNNPFPWYIGESVYSSSYQLTSIPQYPNRAFFIMPDGTYSIRFILPTTQKRL